MIDNRDTPLTNGIDIEYDILAYQQMRDHARRMERDRAQFLARWREDRAMLREVLKRARANEGQDGCMKYAGIACQCWRCKADAALAATEDDDAPAQPEKSAWPEGERQDFADESRERAQAINRERK